MNELAKSITDAAIREVVSSAAQMGAAEHAIPGVVQAQVSRTLEQDPARSSWRVWGAFWSGLAAILAVPEVQVGLQAAVGAVVPVAWAPVVPAVLGAVWAGVSKARDQRPVRTGP